MPAPEAIIDVVAWGTTREVQENAMMILNN